MELLSFIKWGNRYNENYSYGSSIEILNYVIKYSSPRMPVGAKIKEWSSFGQYSSKRVSPLLPLLVGGKKYNVKIFMKDDTRNKLEATIEFFDKYGNVIAVKYFKKLSLIFTYPEKAVDYKINLINLKHDKIEFYFILLMDVTITKYRDIFIDNFNSIELKNSDDVNKGAFNEIVIHYLCKETSVIPISHSQRTEFFITESEESFKKTLQNLAKIIEKTDKKLLIRKGSNFDFLAKKYQIITDIFISVADKKEVVKKIKSFLK